MRELQVRDIKKKQTYTHKLLARKINAKWFQFYKDKRKFKEKMENVVYTAHHIIFSIFFPFQKNYGCQYYYTIYTP